MAETIIKIEHVSKSYGRGNVLDDINLDIRKGEFITIVGPSGCGKTTLLRIIAGLVQADSGTVSLGGKDITSMPPYKRPLNMVFQRYALFPHLNVYENIAFGMKLQKKSEEEIDNKVRRLLKLVSLTDYEERDVNSLSGGQQQRVAIARALANSPQVLLLDEPLSALDYKMRKDMQMELKEMHKKLGLTFINVTHDQEEAITLSDTVIVMNEGKIQQIGTPEDIYNEPCNSFVADFIGASNILDGTMIQDRKVNFIGHDFDCVDEGFAENEPVDIVIRPEDIYIVNKLESVQFTGVVKSCTFKGVHYEMFVDSDNGYELMIQDYNAFEPGSTVGLIIKPQDIQVMHKYKMENTFDAVVIDSQHVSFLGSEFECTVPERFKPDDKVTAHVAFDKVDLLDYCQDGKPEGKVRFIIYKGDHYHLKVYKRGQTSVYVDTNDVYDKGDLVGINIAPEDIIITACDE